MTTTLRDKKDVFHPVELEEGVSSLDGQRIISILNEAEKKIELVNMLPQSIDKKVNSVFSLESISVLKDAANKLKKHTRAIYRHFLSDHETFNKLKQLQTVKEESQEAFELYISHFKKIIYDKLKISVEQEQKQQEALEQITSAEKKMREEIEAKREELKKLKLERETMNSTKNSLIAQLKEELRDIRKSSEESNRKLELKSKQRENAEATINNERLVHIQQELDKLKQKYSDSVAKNRDAEAQARKKKVKSESDVEHWIHKYDTDLGEKQAELDELQVIFNDEHAQLEELLTRFNVLKVQYDVIVAELNVQLELKKKAEMEAMRLHKAATKIQSLFRGWESRKKLKKQKDKGKAQKPKGKK